MCRTLALRAYRAAIATRSGPGARELLALPAAAAWRHAPRHATAAAATLQQQTAQPQARGEEQQQQQHLQPTRFQTVMQNSRLTHIAQELAKQAIQPGDVVVDATCGKGHDSAFLAAAVGSAGTVHAFDIQPAAIAATQQRVAEGVAAGGAPSPLVCHLTSHAEMLLHVGASCARVVMFNLGKLHFHQLFTEQRRCRCR